MGSIRGRLENKAVTITDYCEENNIQFSKIKEEILNKINTLEK
ncbi:hypothetical protein [Clostridium sporogenes]